MKKKLVILSGAGLDAESDVSTFRDQNGLWENHRVEDVASYDGWIRNRKIVLDFYNARHKQLNEVKPNDAHYTFAELEKDFDVYHITQNVSDLLERAGCTNITHLHGELTKMRSCNDDNEIYDWPSDFVIEAHTMAKDGSAMRPHIVWFGEDVPKLYDAMNIVKSADILVIIGTSMQVYPAASLIDYVKSEDVPIYIINPTENNYFGWRKVKYIKDVATKGTKKLQKMLLK
jgi:NAD-dependent deacetylase